MGFFIFCLIYSFINLSQEACDWSQSVSILIFDLYISLFLNLDKNVATIFIFWERFSLFISVILNFGKNSRYLKWLI